MRLSLICLCLLFARAAPAQKFPEGFFDDQRVKEGEALSKTLCGSCHLWPAPEILDRDTWLSGPLPWMMGIVGLSPESLPRGLEGELIRKSGAVLTNSPVSKEEFGKIIAYYLRNAPAKLDGSNHHPAPLTLKQFKPRILSCKAKDPLATMVQFDSEAKRIFAGDGNSSSLALIGKDGAVQQRLSLPSTPVAMQMTPAGAFLACAGSFSPSEQAKGAVVFAPMVDGKFGLSRAVLSSLKRPVSIALGDLNGDGKQDMAVCMFGWYSGSLSWFENRAEGSWIEHELLAKPGALRAEIRDLNNDGHPDVAALIAQRSEQMMFFYNDGKGRFTEKAVFQQQPAFGYSYFEFADMNGDGKIDIITANGDNGDYLSPPKPYHGIRICLNLGNDRFEEHFIHPLPGATKAIARDFDGDGDLDIACIAYYPDYRGAPNDGFVYLENQGGLKFQASTFPESDAGRWLVMDAGDIDGDGDEDLILGAARKGPVREAYVPGDLAKKWSESGAVMMLLENIGKKKATGENARTERK